MRYTTIYNGTKITAKFDGTSWGLFLDGPMVAADRPGFWGITVLQATLPDGFDTRFLVSIRQGFFGTKCLLKVEGECIEMVPDIPSYDRT